LEEQNWSIEVIQHGQLGFQVPHHLFNGDTGICICHVGVPDFPVTAANSTFFRLTGVRANQKVSLASLVDEKSLDKIRAVASSIQQTLIESAVLHISLSESGPVCINLQFITQNSENALLVHFSSPASHPKITAQEFSEYHTYFTLSSAATIILVDGVIRECNQRTALLMLRDEKEIVGHRLSEFSPVPAEEIFIPESSLATYLSELHTGQQSFLDWDIQRTDGTVISTELSASLIPDPGHESFIITLQDISEKKMMSEMLQRKNELLQRNHSILYNLAKRMEKDLYANLNLITEISTESMNVASVGVWVFNKTNTSLTALDYYYADEEAHYTALTAAFEDFGSEADKLFSSLFIETASFGKLQKTGSHYLIVPFRVGNQVKGFIHFENAIINRQWTPEEKDFALSIADIVALSIENDSYQESQVELKKLGRAIEQSPVSVFITNTRGEFEYVNPAFTNITGYTFDDVKNKTPRLLNSGNTPEALYRKLWETVLQGENFTTEIQNRRKNGELFWESLSISPIKDDQNKITHFIALMEDITEKKELITQLTEAKDQAESANRLKSSFLANMSHELRTPMNGIIGYAEVLSDELKDQEYRNMTDTIFRSGKRLMETLNLILDLSRIEANQMEISYSLVEFTPLCEECVILFKESAKKKGLQIFLKSAPFTMTTITDEKIVRNVLINLANNAIKYTTEGAVWFELDIHADSNGQQFAVIRVCDTGIGIPKRDLDVIFEQFRQVSEGMNRAFEGTGLGLTISKKMIELINGKIQVESELGKGSIFSLFIPLVGGTVVMTDSTNYQPREGVQLDYSPVSGNEGKKLSILLVENDPINLEVVATYLLNDYQLIIATDAKSAIEKTDEVVFDAILMDINLGKGMTGLDATRIIREKPHYSDIPIIAMTAFAMKGDKEEFLAAGCSHYLPKPFTKKELFGILNFALTER
jgi:PAS domain S-box-containing protein